MISASVSYNFIYVFDHLLDFVNTDNDVGALLIMMLVYYFRRHKKDYKKKVYDKIERELGFTISKTLLKPE